MKNKMLKKGLAIGMSAFLLASSLAPVSVQAASWKQNKTGWWWQEDNGSYPVSQWKVINGKWYAFDERGYMRSGWFLSNGKWYYLGAAHDGSMKTGWQLVNGSWYYMNPGNGDMAANQWIGNYYVGGSGAMLTNQWIGNYYVDASGKWVPGKTKVTAQWIQSGNRWWYRHADGGYTRNGWELINGSWYYFDNAGWMLSNQWIGNYYVGGSGAMLTDTWIGNYYVDGSGKWVPDAKKDQHTHKWVAETTVIHHDAETKKELVKEAWDETIHHDEETKTVVDKEAWTETVNHPAETHEELVKEAWTETVHHPAETHQELVKEAWTEEIPHEEEGHYEATIPGHYEYTLVPKEGYTEEYETDDGTTETRFVVTEHMHTESKWVDPVTVTCSEMGYEVETPMYSEQERYLCNGCGEDITENHSEHLEENALKGNYKCGSYHSAYIMVQYDTRNVVYQPTYVVDKEAYVEKVNHDAEYKTVVDKEAWDEEVQHDAEYKTVVDKEAWVETINHPAETHEETIPAYDETVHHDAEYKTVVLKEAYDETKTIYKCSCGATK